MKSNTARTKRLSEFVIWATNNVMGTEKDEARLFLNKLLVAFGSENSSHNRTGLRVRNDVDGDSLAELVWKPNVLMEVKRRGTDLNRHCRKAFDNWIEIEPNRPRYVVLCNFDEFWVYDFETQMEFPVDVVELKKLSERPSPLAFLRPEPEQPVFANEHESTTRDAADWLGTCFSELVTRGIQRALAQTFVIQIVVALYSEGIGLSETRLVPQTLDDCKPGDDGYGLIDLLHAAMGKYARIADRISQFNRELIPHPRRLELTDKELHLLKQAGSLNWLKVRPEIFGTLFEHSVEKGVRRAQGQHFTSPADIMRIVEPTIVRPWRQLVEEADSSQRLFELQRRLTEFVVLDPACGSGNFLYVAYRELKRIEARIIERFEELPRGKYRSGTFGFVTARQFHGMDVNPLSIELAKVTMVIAKKLAIDELLTPEQMLPLDNLNRNFVVGDALIQSKPMHLTNERKNWRRPILKNGNPVVVEWPSADAIIGNPPFNGAKKLKPDLGSDYVAALREAYPDIPGMADYCVFWFRKTHDSLQACNPNDPVIGRAGLVGTQNIRNNKSRIGGLDHIVDSGTIVEAVDNQSWSGEAKVHVSIVNWVKHDKLSECLMEHVQAVDRRQLLIPAKSRLWRRVEPKKTYENGGKLGTKVCGLELREVDFVNAALSDGASVSNAVTLLCNVSPQISFQGVIPGYAGFGVDDCEESQLVLRLDACRQIIKPWIIGRDILTGDGKPTRKILDLGNVDLHEAQTYTPAFELLAKRVLPAVRKSAGTASGGMKLAREEHLNRWWQFWNVRSEMRAAMSGKGRYIACSRVTKRPIFVFVSEGIIPDGALQVWSLEDDYSFGVIQSDAHWQWFIANCSKLKSDFRYTRRSVWDTFPWPQFPNQASVDQVAAAAVALRRTRDAAQKATPGGLRQLYRLVELPGQHPLKDAHARLDAAVVKAYRFDASRHILTQLLDLNHAVALREKRGESVTGPGVPRGLENESPLVTKDCIR